MEEQKGIQISTETKETAENAFSAGVFMGAIEKIKSLIGADSNQIMQNVKNFRAVEDLKCQAHQVSKVIETLEDLIATTVVDKKNAGELENLNKLIAFYNKRYSAKVAELQETYRDGSPNKGYKMIVPVVDDAGRVVTTFPVDEVKKTFLKVKGLSGGALIVSQLCNRRFIPELVTVIDGTDRRRVETMVADGEYAMSSNGRGLRRIEYSKSVLPIGLTIELIK